jgi:hypothetical protein
VIGRPTRTPCADLMPVRGIRNPTVEIDCLAPVGLIRGLVTDVVITRDASGAPPPLQADFIRAFCLSVLPFWAV